MAAGTSEQTCHRGRYGQPNAVVRSARTRRTLRIGGVQRHVRETRGCFFRALGWGGSFLARKTRLGRHRRRGKGLPTSEAGLRLVDGQLCRLPYYKWLHATRGQHGLSRFVRVGVGYRYHRPDRARRRVDDLFCRRQAVRDSSPAGLIAALTPVDPTHLIGVGVMDLFGAEKIATVREQSAEICRLCGTKLVLVRVIIDSDTGSTYRMFECKCGERIWND